MIVEYETDGTPYLRIEEEDYMFEDVSLLELSDTFDMETYLDVKKIFNDVLAGSNTTKLVDKGNLIYKQLPIVSWRKETILSCGSCVGEKNNKINLVSDYVIDANIIHEAMITPIGNDYDSDDNIFLLNYFFDGFENKLVGNNTLKYNVNINNENVINNFLGASSECLILSRYTQDYFKVEQQSFLETIAGASFQTSVSDAVTFSDTVSDNNNVINDTPSQIITYNRYLPYPISPVSNTGNASFTHYKCSKNGNYNLVVDLIRMSLSSAFNISGVDLTYFIHLVHYTDDTFTTVINQYTVSETVTNFQTIVDLTLETGLININVGECCLVVFELGYDYNQLGTVATTNFDFTADNFIFYMKGSEFTCEDIQDESDKFRPYVVEFSRPLNACDYNKLKANPKGYINIDGNKCYIEEVNYSLQKTNFKLITNKLIC